MIRLKINNELELKGFKVEEADELFALINENRIYLREWLPWVDGTKSVKDSKAFIDHTVEQMDQNTGLTVGIREKGKLIGIIGYNKLNHANRIGTIGYWLSQHAEGKGVMTKAVQAMISYGFTQLNLNKVEIHAAVKNSKSRRIPEKLGFVYEGTIRDGEWLYDYYVDTVIYGLLKREYK
ncbi:GNAT family N-acetyltransferase [Cytobacillus sp. FSL K6-0265]|uniref:GNAT family N-acetyltransferase n=1 Tax=Cytobacillus sp. FSL K6-0265 TaxID=2921448 RepID=UPI0030FC338D